MDSVNVPVPGRVSGLAADVAADVAVQQDPLPHADADALGGTSADAGRASDAGDVRVRDDHTLVVKRLPEGDRHRVEARAREAVSGTPPFEVRVDRVDYFDPAVRGPSPVVYLAVESPELRRLHDRLVDAFDPVEGMEGEAYTPHVTVARGGSTAAAQRVAGPVEPVAWTVSELQLRDATRGLVAGRVSLPA